MNVAYIPAIITASVALLAAVGAQILSHYLNDLREKGKRMNEIYQEFIYPFISEVLLYYHTETNFRKGHDVENEVDLNNLLTRISEKVSYGNMKLLSCYYQTKVYEYFFDGRGGSKERNILKFMFWYLDYSVEILKKKKPVDEILIEDIVKVQKLYGIWVLVAEELDFNCSIELMKYDFYLYNEVIPQLDMGLLRDLVDFNHGLDYRRANFLKNIIYEWDNGDVSGLDELKNHLELNYE